MKHTRLIVLFVPVLAIGRLCAADVGGTAFTIWWNIDSLAVVKQRALANDPLVRPAYDQAVKMGNDVLKDKIYTVMDDSRMPPSGDPHDFMAFGYYWWPNPNTPDGLPWISRDGYPNPDAPGDSTSWTLMALNSERLGLAYYLTGNETYAARAAQQLRAWFIDPDTKMNPNCMYGVCIPGVQWTGFSIGQFEYMRQVTAAASFIESSSNWTTADKQALQQWCTDMYNWMETNPVADEQRAMTNNHRTYYDFASVVMNVYAGDLATAGSHLVNFETTYIPLQYAPDGTQPLEMPRANNYDYHRFNLDLGMDLAQIGVNLYDNINLYNYLTPQGAGFRPSVDFLLPYFSGEQPWPYGTNGYVPTVSPRVVFSWLQQAAVGYHDPTLWAMAMRNFSSYYYADSNLSTSYLDVCPFWDKTTGGAWSAGTNWTLGVVPQGEGQGAYFSFKNTGTATITLDAPVTLGALVVDATNSYVLAGTCPLTLNGTGGRDAAFDVERGRHQVLVPVQLDASLSLVVWGSTASVTFAGPVTGTYAITKSGSGRAVLAAENTLTGTMTVNAGEMFFQAPQTLGALVVGVSGKVTLNDGATRATSLALSGSSGGRGKLDISDGGLIIDYDSQSPLSQVESLIAQGLSNGQGVYSSLIVDPTVQSILCVDNADLPGGPVSFFGGRSVDATSLLVGVVLAGDVDGNGEVNTDDYFYIDYGLGNAGGGWLGGDLNRDGVTNSDDYFYIDFNLGSQGATVLCGAQGGGTSIPEPATVCLLLAGLTIAVRRQRAQTRF